MRLDILTVIRLNTLAKNSTDVTDTVRDDEFYIEMQTATALDASDSILTPEGQILLANIVADSPLLTTLNMRGLT